MLGPDKIPGSQRIKELDMSIVKTFQPKNKIRFLTATALFDGHDVSINIMRRLLQLRGAEVIHLGHNRTAKEIVDAAIQEDVHSIALSSYQGGHMEFFKYIRQLLDERGAHHVRIYGGGGGVIVPTEIEELENAGISKIYSPEEGQKYGLEGCIGQMIYETDQVFSEWQNMKDDPHAKLARGLTLLENGVLSKEEVINEIGESSPRYRNIPVLGVTGTGGAGKSSLLDELLLRFLFDFPEVKIALLCIDPSKRKTGGALLGDRIRINSCANERIFLRSFASRQSGKELSQSTLNAIDVLKSQDFDFIIVETSGIGQGDTGILDVSDDTLYVMTPEYGASTQLEKIDMLDFAKLIAVNKYERRQGPDAVRDVRTTLRRSRYGGMEPKEGFFPVYGTIASRFNDDGTNGLYKAICDLLNSKVEDRSYDPAVDRIYKQESSNRDSLIPGHRQNYLSDIAKTVRDYHDASKKQVDLVENAEALEKAATILGDNTSVHEKALEAWKLVDQQLKQSLDTWEQTKENYNSNEFTYTVRNKDIKVSASFETLAHKKYPRVALPRLRSKVDIAEFILKENVPGGFPYTAGLFLSEDEVRIPRECLPERVVREEQIRGFITFQRMIQLRGYRQHLIARLCMARTPLKGLIFTEKLVNLGYLSPPSRI